MIAPEMANSVPVRVRLNAWAACDRMKIDCFPRAR